MVGQDTITYSAAAGAGVKAGHWQRARNLLAATGQSATSAVKETGVRRLAMAAAGSCEKAE